MNIYVGNLPFSVGDDELRNLFEAHGEVQSAKVIMDRETGQPRGFGFVEMPDSAGQAAISALHGHNLDGRDLKVNEAKPREPRSGGGGGGGGNRW
ncbi:MAG: RNA-binding protein [Planctomycetes bacterium]|nr:RNA-binding protein [Planctomycetota bacterium]